MRQEDVPYECRICQMTETEGTARTASASSLVRQSRDKLEAVAETLKPWIICISNDDDDDAINKTSKSSSSCSSMHMLPRILTCTDTQQQQAYRCKCSFQLVQFLQEEKNKNLVIWRYAIRRDKQPIVIDLPFPIANRQIQKAMHNLLKELNTSTCSSNSNGNSNKMLLFTQHLTSVSFSSPWQDDDDNCDENENNVIIIDSQEGRKSSVTSSVLGVVVVTLHYVGPIALDETSWKQQARSICQTGGFSQLTGRSKKVIVRAFQEEEEQDESHDMAVRRRRSPSSIYDTLWLEKQTNEEEETSSSACWNVTFLNNNPDNNIMSSQCTTKDDDHDGMMRIPVHYCKPEGAFFHPNASVMMLALKWLLNRVQYIITITNNKTAAPQTITREQRPPLRLLELYCGCGAHTMPLALSRLFSHITALELDERLVRALRHNCRLNNLVLLADDSNSTNRKVQKDNGNHQNDNKNDIDESPQQQPSTADGCATCVVECISSDAGTWAREQQQQQQQKRQQRQWRQVNNNNDNDLLYSRSDDDSFLDYDILLVDPPHNGLDEQVCQLALQKNGNSTTTATTGESSSSSRMAASFSHILYISCGKEALVRDLERLFAGYELVDCVLLDLFPQTEAVETLVHLQRRPR